MALKRFGVSLEDELLESLDSFVKDDGFANRSQAIRFLIEKNLAEKKWQCNHIVAGTVPDLHRIPNYSFRVPPLWKPMTNAKIL